MNTNYFLKYYLKTKPVFMALIRAKEAALFDMHKKYFKGKSLDIGCGDGEFAQMAWGKIDAGIDLPGSRINEASKMGTYKETKLFDGVNIPYKAETFNAVVANCVLEHVEKLEPLLKEINRATKTGGYFSTTVMAAPWESYLIGGKLLGNIYRKWLRKTQDHHNLLSEKEWDAVFKKTGWKAVVKVGYLPKAACHAIEIWHYLSIGYLLSYKLTGKWTWINPAPLLPTKKMAKAMEENTTPDKSGAIFYVLEKTRA